MRFDISSVEIGENNYTIHLKVQEGSLVDLLTTRGVDVTFFNLTAVDMWDLGRQICDEAVKVGYVHKGAILPPAVFHCIRCGWNGTTPACVSVTDPLNPDEVIPEVGCPVCRSVIRLTIEETREVDKGK